MISLVPSIGIDSFYYNSRNKENPGNAVWHSGFTFTTVRLERTLDFHDSVGLDDITDFDIVVSSIFRPQSNPAATSLTSSLKRLSDPSLPV